MGVNLSDLVPVQEIALQDLAGRRVAVDAYNAIYQFLSVIRQPDGTPLKDSKGRVTSHLTGLLYRNINLLEAGVAPIFVFDGVPHELKADTIMERSERRAKAKEEWKEAMDKGDYKAAFCKATQSSRITNEIVESARILLTYMGIPVVQAPEEGEAQAAYMASQGDVWAVASQDFDSLVFGAPRLVRNLAISGRRKMPGRNEYRDVSIELIELDKFLASTGLSGVEQLVDLSIMVGTDYSKGIPGIGPKKGLKLIKEHGTLEKVLSALGKEVPEYQTMRDIFLHSEKIATYDITPRPPQVDNIIQFMCEEHEFSRSRVESALGRILGERREKKAKPAEMPASQSSLDKWG
jgi:flap endonuclease-1